ncbi:MAG TPA: hypothetical protein VG936_11455 [Lacunisphaera sp.]|nr:hypothetical protein [Lacunisphaera sp.]
MNTPGPLAILALLSAVATASASNDRIVTAVFSRVSNGYHRTREADGSFKREYYALMPGHYYPGVGKDGSIDPVKFPQVAGLAAQLLATKNYWFAKDASQATLLLEISWGKTVPLNDGIYRTNLDSFAAAMSNRISPYAFGGQAPAGRFTADAMTAQRAARFDENDEKEQAVGELVLFQAMRRDANQHNARLLGYVDEINRGDSAARFAGLGSNYDDLISDIENERYYIIIAAYDFAAAKAGQMKRQWVTRVSVQAQGNRFNESAAYMLAKASKYFGQDSGRLIRQFDREGKVTLGDLQVVGVVPQSQVEKPVEKK